MIRAATPDDMPALIDMGRAFHEEAGYAEMIPFDPASFTVSLASLGREDFLFVAEQDGKVIGMAAVDMAASIANHNVKCAREAFWYVVPEHRKGKVIGKPLLAALECAAKNRGASFFDGVAEEGARSYALGRLYEARGYNLIERTFRKRL